jgi:Cu2+-exporting ATPase
MTCCAAPTHLAYEPPSLEQDDAALLKLSRTLGDGRLQLEFAVPDAHCAQCIRTLETALSMLPQVEDARVNLSKRRVRIAFDPDRGGPSELAKAIRQSGYHTFVVDAGADRAGDPVLQELIRALAVAGFAAGNIMLFSVSIWAGADAATRDLFHWISALIALPAIAYAGLPFFRSAWRALRVGRTNMDVPITIGVLLATLLSLYETIVSGEHAYFDASTTLLFFLLVGRTLDHLMRERARTAITNLARLAPPGAVHILDDGQREYIGIDEIEPGMLLEIKVGDRVPIDATVTVGLSALDYSVLTGEPDAHPVEPGSSIMAGSVNLVGPLTVRAERIAAESFLGRIAAMMEAAEGVRSRSRRIADRTASVYAPVVHVTALLTFLGWGIATGDWHSAVLNAVAVLIITCPCALALAVPIAHVVAAGRLFGRGILIKDGAALERAAGVDRVMFDKTGTLTFGRPRLVDYDAAPDAREVAAALARTSSHPLSRALVTAFGSGGPFAGTITEIPGQGIEGRDGGTVWRLGSAGFCGITPSDAERRSQAWLTANGRQVGHFSFDDAVRPDARRVVQDLHQLGLEATILSGDRPGTVARLAEEIGADSYRAALLPQDKVTAVAAGKAMMVGDGINDAPALRAAHVSVAPASATDIGRTAADFVFTGDRLDAVPYLVRTARQAQSIVRQNIVLAIAYNALAVPLAIFGLVTPLVAAIAMSSSSILVVANALRLRWDGHRAPAGTSVASDRSAIADGASA